MKNQKHVVKSLVFATAAFAGASLSAYAQGTPVANPAVNPTAAVPLADPNADAWQFGVTLPLWALGIDGDATVRGNQRDVNKSFSDIKDHLDESFSLGLEARKGKWGVYGGVGYMKFSNDGAGALGVQGFGELKFVIADAGVSYRLVKTEGERPFILECTAGIRYWYAETSLTLVAPGGGVLFDNSNNKNLVDPMIGIRASQFITAKLHLDFAGDIGGFGLSDNQSDLDWSATGLVTYDFVKWFSLSAGYKAVGLDTSSGSGTSENGVNLTFHGALIALKFKF